MLLDILDQRLSGPVPGLEDNERLDDQPPDHVGRPDDRCLLHGGVLHERALHLEGPDTVAGGLDDVVIAADEPEVAVLIHTRLVTGVVEPVLKDPLILLFVVQVAAEEPDRAGIQFDRDAPLLPDADRVSIVIVEFDMPARRGPPHGAGFTLHARERPDTEHRLGLAVALVDRPAGPLLPCPDHLGIERFASAAAVPEVSKIKLIEVGEDQHPVDGRGAAERRNPVALKQR